MLKVYSASWCSPCTSLKAMLDKNNIEYENIDIDSNPEEARQLGIRGVPTLVNTVTGETKIGNITLEQVKVLLA